MIETWGLGHSSSQRTRDLGFYTRAGGKGHSRTQLAAGGHSGACSLSCIFLVSVPGTNDQEPSDMVTVLHQAKLTQMAFQSPVDIVFL